MAQTRVLVAHCPYWALVVAGIEPSVPAVVVQANRVVVASPAAEAEGARVGMRRREAQGACPAAVVARRDMASEVRQWELAVAAVEAFAPGVEVTGPGELAISSKGPSRYFGGDQALAQKVAVVVGDVVMALMGGTPAWAGYCRVGLADGIFTAKLAARLAGAPDPLVVPAGASRAFLAPLPVRSLLVSGELAAPPSPPKVAGPPAPVGHVEELVDLLVRLGVKKLGDLATLPAPAVFSRFGPMGLQAHHLASGEAERAVKGRQPPPVWRVSMELDPPAEQLQEAVFVGRSLAEQLHQQLKSGGLVCTRLTIEAETQYGTLLRRSWRHDGALSAAAIGERVRWQLEGWAQAGTDAAQAGPVTMISLVPEEICPDTGRQLGFWGGDAGAEERAARAFARVQSLLGPTSVLVPVLRGGRDYCQQVQFVPWGEPRPGGSRAAVPSPARPRRRRLQLKPVEGAPPWPGRLPGVAPSVVYRRPLAAQVLDAEGNQVTVDGRGAISARPAWLAVAGGRRARVEEWAGPWPLEERWWEAGGRRRARLQVSASDGSHYLLAREKRQWWVEATYD